MSKLNFTFKLNLAEGKSRPNISKTHPIGQSRCSIIFILIECVLGEAGECCDTGLFVTLPAGPIIFIKIVFCLVFIVL